MLKDFDLTQGKVYIKYGYTDLRKGIDSLVNMVKQSFGKDPFEKSLYLFCGRRRDRIKGLYFEGDGFVLLIKRLETGVYQWPRTEDEVRELTSQQFRWLMEGLKIEQPKVIKPLDTKDIIL